jgi:hypothetical protein
MRTDTGPIKANFPYALRHSFVAVAHLGPASAPDSTNTTRHMVVRSRNLPVHTTMRNRILRAAAIAALAAAAGCDSYVTGFASLPIDNDPSLASLRTTAGSLDPSFSSSRTAFNLAVPDSIGQISVAPTAAASTSRILVNGQEVVSGSLSAPITLTRGTLTSIPVQVTAQSGVARTYTIAVLR